ncbi:MAG TPA: DUF1684 domain-containing protein [Ktedonobacterales bacterium]|nr:DUF1684 domain-containing protein [Ktedonobacterales bacterium]
MSDQLTPEEIAEREDYTQQLTEFRRQKDHFFGSSPQSPIPAAERRSGFHGLNYYPPNPDFQIVAQVTPITDSDVVELNTSTGDMRPQRRAARLAFTVGDADLTLVGFTDPDEDHLHELFIPFRDATSGGETYGAGRYLEAVVDQDDDGALQTVLDFNLAYNPYCAYSEDYSCPIPPAENRLAAPITAGERTYGEGH